MTFVARYEGGRSVVYTAAAGDWLVAVSVSDGIPSWPKHDWELLEEFDLYTPRFRARMRVFARRATQSGTWVEQFEPYAWSTALFRFSGAKELRTLARSRVQNARPTWPSLDEGGSGDVVHVGLLELPSAPADDVVRWQSQIAIVATRDVSNVTMVPVASSLGPRTDGWALTLFLASSVRVPTPVLVSPPEAVDVAADFQVAWDPIEGQTGFRLSRRINGGAWQYWTGLAWGSSETEVSGSGSSFVFSGWANASSYELRVRAAIGGDLSEWSTVLAVWGVASPPAPTLVVSSTDSRKPLLIASGPAGAGATLSGFDIEVSIGGNVWTSVDADPDGAWLVDRPLPDGPVSARARTVQNAGVQRGPWSTPISWVVAVPPAPAPGVTASRIAHPVSGLPGVQLAITTTLVGTVGLQVERDGVLEMDDEITEERTVDDWKVGQVYRVRILDTGRGGEPSPWVTVSVPGSVDQSGWLMTPLRPEDAVHVCVMTDSARTYDLRSDDDELLDRSLVVVTPGVALEPSGSLTVRTSTKTERSRVLGLLGSGDLLRLQIPRDEEWAGSSQFEPGDVLTFRPVGKVQVSRVQGLARPRRLISFEWRTQEV